MLDGEFAFVIKDAHSGKMMAARDPMGIRTMFYCYTKEGKIAFASTAKALYPLCHDIMPFEPGCYYDGEKFVKYNDLGDVKMYVEDDIEQIAYYSKSSFIDSQIWIDQSFIYMIDQHGHDGDHL